LSVRARLIGPLDRPLAAWFPGNPPPDFGAIAYRADKRFSSLPVSSVTCYRATRKALRLYGVSPKGRGKLTQATHDLGVTEIYLHYHKQHLQLLPSWRGEDHGYRLPGGIRPDAVLHLPCRGRTHVLDFITDYGRARVAALHEACADSALSYEMW